MVPIPRIVFSSSFPAPRNSFPKPPNHGLGFYAKTVVISANQTKGLAGLAPCQVVVKSRFIAPYLSRNNEYTLDALTR